MTQINFKKQFNVNGNIVTVESERAIKVVSDNDSFYLFDGLNVPQAGTLGNNFHPYAWDNIAGEFKRCPDPESWGFNTGAKVSDLKFSDVDYGFIYRLPVFAKAVWADGSKEVDFYSQDEIDYFLDPKSKYVTGHKQLFENGEIIIKKV